MIETAPSSRLLCQGAVQTHFHALQIERDRYSAVRYTDVTVNRFSFFKCTRWTMVTWLIARFVFRRDGTGNTKIACFTCTTTITRFQTFTGTVPAGRTGTTDGRCLNRRGTVNRHVRWFHWCTCCSTTINYNRRRRYICLYIDLQRSKM